MPRIALCMIVRDEEATLAACLRAALPAVDEVCVLDTGSTDSTRAVAERMGARVECRAWTDDFAAARNAALAMTSADWVLSLDADEVLLEPERARERLLAFAGAHPAALGRVEVRNRDAAGELTTLQVTRFFPAAACTWTGRVHEQVTAAGPERARRDTGLAIDHRGYELSGAARTAKLGRNLRLLEAALTDDPEDGYLWFQLGRTRALSGDHESALAALEQGLARCPDDAPWAASVLEAGAYSLRALDRSEQALALLSEVEAAFAQRADTCFLIALLAMDCGQLERAERGFRRCLELAGSGPGPAESSPAASTFAPAINLAVMAEVHGRRDEARAWYRRALEHRPDHPAARQGLARVGG